MPRKPKQRKTLAARIRTAPIADKFKLALDGPEPETVFTRLVDTWAAVRKGMAQPGGLDAAFLRDARSDLATIAYLAMLRDDSQFFHDLADAMAARRQRKRVADPVRAVLYSLMHTARLDATGKPLPKLSNTELVEALAAHFKDVFPDHFFDERAVRRMKKDLLPPPDK